MGNYSSHLHSIITFSAISVFYSVFSFAQVTTEQTEEKIISVQERYPPVKVRLINATGYRLDSIYFYNNFFAVLEKDSATSFFKIPNYEDGYDIKGKIEQLEIRSGLPSGWDGKPVPYNYPGETINVEIILRESRIQKGVFRLYTKFKQRVNKY